MRRPESSVASVVFVIAALASCGDRHDALARIESRLGMARGHSSVFEDSRPILAAAAKTSIQAKLPTGCRLELAYAGLSPAEALGVSATLVGAGGERTVLLSDDSPSGGGWHEHRLPLEATGDVTLELETRGRPEAILWAQPLLSCPLSPAEVRRPNVLLISLDTLRADRLASYGSLRALTPNLDALAKESALFENAYSQYPNTIASHATIFTGLYPTQHGLISGDTGTIPSDLPTLARLMAAAGYHTGAFTENAYVGSAFGFNGGFDVYHDGDFAATTLSSFGGDVRTTFNRAMVWMDARADENFFLFVHTYKVHAPRNPAAETTLKTLQHRLGFEYSGAIAPGYDPLYEFSFNRGVTKWTADDIRMIEMLYDAEVRELDSEVGRLLAHLRSSGLGDSTLVVVFADHGEEFAEHGTVGHGDSLHGQALHVPLLVHFPGRIQPGLRVQAAVGLIDLAPTILELAGVDATLPGTPARSLGPHLREAAPSQGETVVSELIQSSRACGAGESDGWKTCPFGGVGVRDDRYSYLVSTAPAARKLYDRKNDPGEATNVASAHPDLTARFDAAIREHERLVATPAARSENQTVDPATRDRLRGLGYIQ